MREGVLPDCEIKDLIDKKAITSNEPISEKQIQPSSIDLRCSSKLNNAWRMPYSSIPTGNLKEFLEKTAHYCFSLESGFIDEGDVYVIELEEFFDLPEGISAKSNPKSTTGRLDIHTRLLTDEGMEFDNIRAGYKGGLFLEVISRSFGLRVPPGHSFNQVRFFRGGRDAERLDSRNLEYLAEQKSLLVNIDGTPINQERSIMDDGTLSLTLSLDPNDPGYVARSDVPSVFDLSVGKGTVPFSRFFHKVSPDAEGLVIVPGLLYLLGTKEIISIPENHCAEMVDVATGRGEFRAHYAGFFDPGFNARGVMEVRNISGENILLRPGQPISSLWFYRLTQNPSKIYGKDVGSSYQGQTGIRGAKFFDMNE
tara:strand:+ start:150 stop:1250 length:1101 start_codon:yes stop_codon:yes gene_type:complete